MTTPDQPTMVTIDRVIATAAELGLELEDSISGRAAQVTFNGLPLLFVLLETVLIVRTDAATDEPADSGDATYYLVANQANASYLQARQIVVNRGETLVARSESEIHVEGGLSDEQLTSALRRAIDAVVLGQQIMMARYSDFAGMREGFEDGPGVARDDSAEG